MSSRELDDGIADDPRWRDRAETGPRDAAEREAARRGGSGRIIPANSAHLLIARVLAGHVDDVRSVAFSPDGALVATGSADGTARVWDPRSGAVRLVLRPGESAQRETQNPDGVRRVAFFPDGTLLTVLDSGAVPTWDTASDASGASGTPGAARTAFTAPDDAVTEAAFSPDGALLAVGSAQGTIHLWDVRLSVWRAGFLVHGGAVRVLAFSPDATLLVTGSDDRSCRLWDVPAGARVAKLKHRGVVSAAAFSPYDTTLATACGEEAFVWDIGGRPRLTWTVKSGGLITDVAFSADGTLLATASEDRTVRIWNVVTRQEAGTLADHTGRVHAVAFSPDGTMLAGAGGDRTARIWSPAGGPETGSGSGSESRLHAMDSVHRRSGRVIGEQTGMTAAAFGRDAARLATAGGGAVALWRVSPDAATVARWHDYPAVPAGIRRVLISRDGTQIAVVVRDGTVEIRDLSAEVWNLGFGGLRRTFGDRSEQIDAVAFSPHPFQMAMMSGDVIRLWNRRLRNSSRTFQGFPGTEAASFSPDGERLLTGSADGAVRIHKIGPTDPPTAIDLRGHTGRITDAAFSPGGSFAAAASDDTTARLWTNDGEHLATLAGHWSQVNALAFAPDGRSVATASQDKTIRVWSTPYGRPTALLTGHTDAVLALVFSPNGRRILSASADGTIRVWDL